MSSGILNEAKSNPSISLDNLHDGTMIESRLADLCKSKLLLDESTLKQVMELLKESSKFIPEDMSSIGGMTGEEIERMWFAFILFSVKRLAEGNKEKGYRLCQILRPLKLRFMDFFKEIPQFLLKTANVLSKLYGMDWEKRVKVREIEADFTNLSHLSQHYKCAYRDLFLTADETSDESLAITSCMNDLSDYCRFGWLLFLVLRIHGCTHFKDLAPATSGLLSVLAILILHVPLRFRKFSLRDSPHFVRNNNKDVDLIASLCKIYPCSEDEVKRMMQKVNNLIEVILKKKPCWASECKSGNLDNINKGGLIYFEDLMEGTCFSSSLVILEKDYDLAIHNKELDERVFINDEEDGLLGTVSLSGVVTNICGFKRKFDYVNSMTESVSTLSPPFSPSTPLVKGSFVDTKMKMAPPTPVRTTMKTVKWLRTVISPLPSKPSAELESFLSSCDMDLTNDVTCRANKILEVIFPGCVLGERCFAGSVPRENLLNYVWAEERRMDALKLYYRVLEAICRAEHCTLHGGNLTLLLASEKFHKCMLACSAELILAAHMTVTMLFPAVLERTGITAFDLSKIIESFVRHEETLPGELKEHLNSLEERLLESMAWEKGSSMYDSLIVAKPDLSTSINHLGLLSEPIPSLGSIAMHQNISARGLPPQPPSQKHEILPDENGDSSPEWAYDEQRNDFLKCSSFISPVMDGVQSILSSGQPNQAVAETRSEKEIRVFFHKTLKLAAMRIKNLCQRLKLSKHLRESVYRFIQKILHEHTSLFFNRHIDQLILCSLYIIAKSSQLGLTFKEVMSSYKKQPHYRPHISSSVFIDWSSAGHNKRTQQEHVSILKFYNDIFVPYVTPLVEELHKSLSAGSEPLAENNNNAEGESPRIRQPSPFPSLPDMSPKKVSPAHNVYVSPLRASKMDALISSNRNSQYAYVGEKTQIYQSPSRDLFAINERLNSNIGYRKVRGRLNFDDATLVTDDVVARNLVYLQSGS